MTDADRIAAIVRKAEDSCCNVTIDEIRWLADRATDRLLTVDGCPGCAGALAGLVDTICDTCRAAVVDALARPLTVGAANPAPTGERRPCAEWEKEGNEWVMCAGAFLLVVWVRECKDDAGNVTHGWRVNDGDDDVAFCAYTVPLTLEAAQLAAEAAAAEMLRAGLRALGCK